MGRAFDPSFACRCLPSVQARLLQLKTRPGLQEFLSGEAGVRVVWRERREKSSVRRNARLRDGDVPPSFYWVPPGESAIFVSGKCPRTRPHPASPHACTGSPEDPTVELVVLRGVGMGHDFSDRLYAWLDEVVRYAVDERRNVRASVRHVLLALPSLTARSAAQPRRRDGAGRKEPRTEAREGLRLGRLVRQEAGHREQGRARRRRHRGRLAGVGARQGQLPVRDGVPPRGRPGRGRDGDPRDPQRGRRRATRT